VIRVLVAASSPVVRAGLDALLRAEGGGELEVVGSAAGDADAVADAVARLAPDVVLLEVERQQQQQTDGGGGALPATLPAALVAALGASESRPALPAAVLLTDDPDATWVASAIRAGVRGALPRGAGTSEIVAAVEGAAAGLVVVHPDFADALLAALAHDAPLGHPPSAVATSSPILTPRESEVLGMLAAGLGNKQIAPRLGITEHTVKYHVASIFAKLGASSRTEAVTIAARRGLVML